MKPRWSDKKVVSEPVKVNTTCPNCGRINDAVSGVLTGEKQYPEPGDVTICIGCGEWNVYVTGGPDGTLRMPTDDEHIAFAKNPLMQHVRAAYNKAVAVVAEEEKGRKRK